MGDSKQLRGFSSQFFVAGELSRRGVVAVVTNGNCPNTDILCSNVEGDRFVHVQVKTFVPGRRPTCHVGPKAERDFGESFFWVLSGIPLPGDDQAFAYYVVPAKDMAANVGASHQVWLDTPGKKGQAHSAENKMRVVRLPPGKCLNGWDLAGYRNRWDLITDALKSPHGDPASA